MIYDALSLAAAVGGIAIIVTMLMRNSYLPPLARYAVIGAAFGLFTSSRYVAVDHSLHAAFFSVGVSGLMAAVAVRHFRAFPPSA